MKKKKVVRKTKQKARVNKVRDELDNKNIAWNEQIGYFDLETGEVFGEFPPEPEGV